VSPTEVHFHVPPETVLGTADVVVTNSDGFPSHGSVSVLRAAPGIFTKSGDGFGEGQILNADTLQPGPFDPTSGNLRLIIFATGVRHHSSLSVSAGGRALSLEAIAAPRRCRGSMRFTCWSPLIYAARALSTSPFAQMGATATQSESPSRETVVAISY
jgi:hypothetical protein